MKEYVLITGATSGIGREFVKIFASQGFNVVLSSTNDELLNREKEKLEKKYKNVSFYTICKDLSKENAGKELYEELVKNNIDVEILINNAGFGYFSKFVDSDIEKNKDLMKVNNNSLVELSYYFGKDMAKRRHGRILNVASIAAFEGGPYMATYFASKAFVLSFSEALSQELKKDNVTVTCICPGPTRTNFEKNADLEKSFMFKKLKVTTPEYVANVGYNALMTNKTYVTVGWLNKIMIFLSRFTPRKINTKLAEYINLGKLNK